MKLVVLLNVNVAINSELIVDDSDDSYCCMSGSLSEENEDSNLPAC